MSVDKHLAGDSPKTRLSTLRDWLPQLVARLPMTIYVKLLAAFLVIVLLLIAVGAAGLNALSEDNRRAEALVALQRKIVAYRQLQNYTSAQLLNVSSALLSPDAQTLDSTQRQLSQFGYDLDRLQFVSQDEVALFAQIQPDYKDFIQTLTQVIELIRAGQVADAQQLERAKAVPLADRLERSTNELVNRAEAEIVAQTDLNRDAYATSIWVVIGFALGSIALALLLGYALSGSLVNPVRRMDARFNEIAAGDFSRKVVVSNRDELGSLAANLNRMSDELGRLYAEIQDKTLQLEIASRHKSAFLANMSHELRTPLNAINGFSEVLLERFFGELNPKQEEYLGDILTSGRHLLSLINDILDLSKVEAGRMELEPSCFDVREALQNGITMIKERAARHSIELRLEMDDGVNTIQADERKIKQTVFNLLSNAVKFTGDGGQVGVQATRQNGDLRVAVWDTGIGIAPADQALIFEEFRQAHGDYTQKREGTGLGLSLAKKFVELHGGRIWVESAVGQGSRFTFSIPVRESSEER